VVVDFVADYFYFVLQLTASFLDRNAAMPNIGRTNGPTSGGEKRGQSNCEK
jgi:hypothetical protein